MKKLIKILSITIIIISALFFAYFLQYSKADNLLVIPSEVEVSQNSKGLFYDGPGVDNLLIFYPGAKVDTKAYVPIVSKLAEYFKSGVWQKVFQERKLYGKGNSGRKLCTVWKLRKTVR